jgi:hypothetical protein
MTAAASWLGLLVDAARRVPRQATVRGPGPRRAAVALAPLAYGADASCCGQGAANFCWRPGTSVPGRFGQLLIDTRAPVPLTHNATTGGHPPRLPGDVHRDPKDRYPLRRRWRVIYASCPGGQPFRHQRDAKTAHRCVSYAARLLIRLLTNS